ncbi:MAG: RNA polymerase sigma factor [Candidatus Vogelbacteria bacterium]|nr:RNA polymerase sigma factor [Candidatus Vogelbacteria bacterium]
MFGTNFLTSRKERKEIDIAYKSDEELLVLSVKHPAMFSFIIKRYEQAFRRKVVRIIGDRDEVEDVLQEAFTRIYMNASKYEKRVGATFSSWAYTILLNVALTYYAKLKKQSFRQLSLDSDAFTTYLEPSEDRSEEKEAEDHVVSILVRMPRMLSRILSLHFIEDKPQEEIANSLHISVAAVKSRIHRAKREFRKLDQRLSLAQAENNK